MLLATFLRAILIGLSIAAPVGPIGVLCIRRTLSEGRRSGFVSGLGAASADGIYGFVAAFGLSMISGYLLRVQNIIQLAGGLFLCYLGIRTLLEKPADTAAQVKRKRTGLLSAYASTFALTLTNPATILSFLAIMSGLGISQQAGSAVVTVVGVIVGSALWWLALSSGIGLVREKFNARAMRAVNILSGLIILAFGGYSIVSLLARLLG